MHYTKQIFKLASRFEKKASKTLDYDEIIKLINNAFPFVEGLPAQGITSAENIGKLKDELISLTSWYKNGSTTSNLPLIASLKQLFQKKGMTKFEECKRDIETTIGVIKSYLLSRLITNQIDPITDKILETRRSPTADEMRQYEEFIKKLCQDLESKYNDGIGWYFCKDRYSYYQIWKMFKSTISIFLNDEKWKAYQERPGMGDLRRSEQLEEEQRLEQDPKL